MALVIGLTGGVASGKSAVEAVFRALEVPVIDADQVSRQVVEPGEPTLAAIAERFGRDILAADGSLNRRALREIVFADAAARRDLEVITHPPIRAALAAWKGALTAPYGVLSAAILVEMGLDEGPNGLCDRVLVVDVPVETQRKRLMARDGVDAALAEQMLAAQAPRQRRLAAADDVVVNDGALDALPALVGRLHAHYLAVAAGQADPARRLRLP